MTRPLSIPEAIERIKQIICEILDIDKESLRDDLAFAEDLFVDSLLAMEIIAAVEDEFEIEIGMETLMDIETPGDLYRVTASLAA